MSFTPTVLAGPSGVGKGTVLASLCLLHPQVWLSVSVTTRQPRPCEVNGRDYFFITKAQFNDLVASDGLLEWASYQSARYGTPRKDVTEMISQGRPVIMELDLQGARQVVARLSPVRTVFLAPPSMQELERRLRARGTESESAIARRLEAAKQEIAHQDEFDHVIINAELALTVSQLIDLIGLGSFNSLPT